MVRRLRTNHHRPNATALTGFGAVIDSFSVPWHSIGMRCILAVVIAITLMIAPITTAWAGLTGVDRPQPALEVTHQHNECPRKRSELPHDMNLWCMDSVLHCSAFIGLPYTWRLGSICQLSRVRFAHGDAVLDGLTPELKVPPPKS